MSNITINISNLANTQINMRDGHFKTYPDDYLKEDIEQLEETDDPDDLQDSYIGFDGYLYHGMLS